VGKMSDAQIRKLFTELQRLTGLVEEMSEVTRSSVAKVDLVVAGYQQHGGAIEHLRTTVERLRLKCPLLGTDEHPAVCVGEGGGTCRGGDS
jgi:hypothetical protein